MKRALVIGSGYLGSAIRRGFTAAGMFAATGSRSRPPGDDVAWHHLDVLDREPIDVVLCALQPDVIVLVHGPSDITWCEAHPDDAMRVHLSGAVNVAQLAGGARIILVSTDNVFPGADFSYPESAPIAPYNAYARAKAAAESVILSASNGAVLRTSLVYGWQRDRYRQNFFAACHAALSGGRPFAAPSDHWVTPVLVDDLVDATIRMLNAPRAALVHVGSPRPVSRYDWACAIADAFALDRDLVSGASKEATIYRCRPPRACLRSERIGELTSFDGFFVRDFEAGLDALRSQYINLTELASDLRPIHGSH